MQQTIVNRCRLGRLNRLNTARLAMARDPDVNTILVWVAHRDHAAAIPMATTGTFEAELTAARRGTARSP